ncbi:charged multivesicular body protein 7-like [Palaemon carinicauda]|uniref:charged multivesicular body protein 7-like n=1 Tax=Palaemon carinicauda TaxID=392227 RepID=UPI0035B5C64A
MDDHRPYLPPEWSNEERIRTLMGPMPVAQDEVARTARLTFWTAAIHHWCSVTKKLTFTLQESLSAFRRGTQQPLCLPEVLLHMNRLGEVVPLDELPLGESDEESWVGWGRRVFIATPSRFAWNKVKQALGANNIQSKVFVNAKLLQEMCEAVFNSYWNMSLDDQLAASKPLSFSELYSKVGGCVGSADSLHLVVERLVHDGRAATTLRENMTYVKLAVPGSLQKPVITQMELAENELCIAQKTVENNVSKLEQEIAGLQQEVMTALKAKSKTKALASLRRKKRAEKSLFTQMGALENVNACLLQLQETQVNKQVLGAFRNGVEAIRCSIAGDSSADSAANTMDELQQVLEECQDISSLLASGVSSQGTDVDEDMLSEELDQLVAEDQNLNQIDTNLANQMQGLGLPDVPKTNPLASVKDLSGPSYSPPLS